MIKYCNFSGGADGSDIFWELEGEKYGIKTISFSFYGHKTKSLNKKELSKEELDEGFTHVIEANLTLKRNIYNLNSYVKKLLSRNWYQVVNSDAVFAVVHMINDKTISGGTGWACQMAIDNNKFVFIYDSNFNSWFEFDYIDKKFKRFDGIPKLTQNFAGIGTREIDGAGILAIKELYKYNFK